MAGGGVAAAAADAEERRDGDVVVGKVEVMDLVPTIEENPARAHQSRGRCQGGATLVALGLAAQLGGIQEGLALAWGPHDLSSVNCMGAFVEQLHLSSIIAEAAFLS